MEIAGIDNWADCGLSQLTEIYEKNSAATLISQSVGTVDLKRTVPATFTATETSDIGVALVSTVSLNYFDRQPFAFTGKIESVRSN